MLNPHDLMAIGILGIGTASACAQQVVPEEYEMVYHQDFEGEAPLADFVFTDPEAWSLESRNGGHALALTEASDYQPPVHSPRNIALLTAQKFDSFVLEARVMYTGRDYNHADLCLFFGIQDPAHYYYTHIGKSQDPHAHQIFAVDGEPRTAITNESRTDGFPWQQGRWERLRLVRDAEQGKVKVFIRNMAEPMLETTDDRFGAGWIGFGTFDDRGLIDDIHVWAPADETEKEPAPLFDRK